MAFLGTVDSSLILLVSAKTHYHQLFSRASYGMGRRELKYAIAKISVVFSSGIENRHALFTVIILNQIRGVLVYKFNHTG